MFGTIVALLMVLAHGSAQSNSSCVQVVNSSAGGVSPYADDEPSLAFTMEGATNLKTNTVNVVVVVDGSPSISADNFVLEQQFAKDTVEAFGRRNIFDNGGTASYVQFSGTTYDEGTFDSPASFNAHVDAVIQTGSGTNIVSGLSAGEALLNANASSFGFIVLVTDGESTSDPVPTAVEIRADNTTTIFAVGVGSAVSVETLQGIAGKNENVFSVTDFESLAAAVADIEVIADETVLSCPATGVTITVEFNVSVSSVDSSGAAATGAAISGDNRVTFTADDLEDSPTQFAVGLERCGEVTSIDYDDEQGNVPDFSSLPDPTCNEPARTGTGRGAAILTSVVIVSAAVLTTLANMIEDERPASSSSTDASDAQGGQSAMGKESQKQRAVTSGEKYASQASPDDGIAEELPKIYGDKDAPITGNNPNRKTSPDDVVAEGLSGNNGEQEAATTGGNPASKTSPDDVIAEDISANSEEQEAATTGGNPASKTSPDEITEKLSRSQGAVDSLVTGDSPSGQERDVFNMEVNDPPAGDANGQVALLALGSLPSTRSPSSTLVWLMVVQAQFLAVLSLVDSVGSGNSWLANFLEHLRWLNFWVPIGEDSDDATSISESDNDIGEEGFVGNIVMFWCIGLLILVLHVLVVSAIEAYWLQATKHHENVAGACAGFEKEDRQETRGPPPSYEEMTEAAPTYGEVAKSGVGPAAVGGAANGKLYLEPVAKCREHSRSIWIHFPHVELVFLLYAVQGSLAAQLDVLRRGDGVMFYVAAIALVIYPVFVVGMMCRVIFFRVRPAGGGMTFALAGKDSYYAGSGRRFQRFCSRVLKGLEEEQSAFAWAKKGVWRTACVEDVTERRLGDWFRIGFEPLFVDFTQSGSWFAVYALVESCSIACVGVLLDGSSQLQLLIFMGLNSASFVVVACLTPFANRVVNIIAACRVGLNAICMALLVVAEAEDVTVHATRLESAVGNMELVFLLLGFALPVFVDTVTVIVAVVRRKTKRTAACCGARNDQTEATGPAEQKETAGRCVPKDLRATWFSMIRRNSGAYVKDVANGFRRKPHSA